MRKNVKRNSKEALRWITDILKKHNVRFHIAGGLVAHTYGAKRELADIDIDIPEDDFQKILPDIKEHITSGPRHHVSKSWDLLLMTLQYEGQEIDIAGAYKTKLFDKNLNQWVSAATDFSNDEMKEIFGIEVSVMSKEELIAYKTKLQREVDLKDLEALKKSDK